MALALAFCRFYLQYLWYWWWPYSCAGLNLSHGVSYPYGYSYKPIHPCCIYNDRRYNPFIGNHIVFSIAIPTSIGAIFGAQVGARIAKRLKAKSILALMSVAVFALAVRLILKSGILG